MVRERKEIGLSKENGISFASFYCALKDAWNGKVSDQELINLLFGFVTTPAEVFNRNGDPFYIDSGDASRIKTGKMDVQCVIREARQDRRVLSTIEDSFAKMVLPKLNSSKIEQLQLEVLSLVRDSACSSGMKRKMTDLAQSESLAKFLAEAFLESLAWVNSAPQDVSKRKTEPSRKDKPLPRPPVPSDIAPQEMPYVDALMRVYGEIEGTCSIGPSNIDSYPNHRKHFKRQRTDYYAAEALRRGLRDAYDEPDDDQFRALEDEVYDGVIDTYECEYGSGMDRLRHTLKQSVQISADKCFATRDTSWIGNSEKKGMCHILVNDERIRGWLDDDV